VPLELDCGDDSPAAQIFDGFSYLGSTPLLLVVILALLRTLSHSRSHPTRQVWESGARWGPTLQALGTLASFVDRLWSRKHVPEENCSPVAVS
jgi:hypothetical protein